MEASFRNFKASSVNRHICTLIKPHHGHHAFTFPSKLSLNPSVSLHPNTLFPRNRYSFSRYQPSLSATSTKSSFPFPNSNPLGFLSSLSASHSTNFPNEFDNHSDRVVSNGSVFEWHPASEAVNGGGAGVLDGEKCDVTVVLLGWLGAKPKHLKRYVDMYNSMGINAVTFVVSVKDVLWFDLGNRVLKRIDALSNELASWLSESENDGRKRCLIFHTFSNTGWIVYGIILENLQGRPDLLQKIKGCIVDSGGDPELNPKVWAAGFSTAMLKKRSSLAAPPVNVKDGKDSGTDVGNLKMQEKEPLIIETVLLLALEKLFSGFLMIPDVYGRLIKILSVLSKNQPPCPQLYLYSTGDKVIPFRSVELFIEDQRRIGKKVWSYNFGLSPHVDHYRTYPEIYSSELRNFLKECLSASVSQM